MKTDSKRTILVTGFGPFGEHIKNASWEAVKELKKLCHETKELHDVDLITKEIPVSYDEVFASIPKLWEEYNPIIVLHVGVSHKADCLTIEYRAHSSGYKRLDIYNSCPNEINIRETVLQTELNVHEVCDNLNKNSNRNGCKACISDDAGRFLCEYIFYQSLCIKPMGTLFVHVPDFDKYSSKQTAKGLHDILCYLIKITRDQ